jgi:hypothetical protein
MDSRLVQRNGKPKDPIGREKNLYRFAQEKVISRLIRLTTVSVRRVVILNCAGGFYSRSMIGRAADTSSRRSSQKRTNSGAFAKSFPADT